jgi:hypothetical protein
MDACMWLLDNGVSPSAITWIRPRDAWLYDRQYFQPLDMVSWLVEGVSLSLEAAANAQDVFRTSLRASKRPDSCCELTQRLHRRCSAAPR